MESNEDLLKAQAWLNDEQSRQIDLEESIRKIVEISDAIKNDKRIDPTDTTFIFEQRAKDSGVSFNGLTKSQQLQIIDKLEHFGPAYDAFISNASFHIFTLAQAGYNDVEHITKGFSGDVLKSLYLYVSHYNRHNTEFNKKLEEIKNRVLISEQESADYQDQPE